MKSKQERLEEAENLCAQIRRELDAESTPEPRPYYYGQTIRDTANTGEGGLGLTCIALAEVGFTVYTISPRSRGHAWIDMKSDLTHLDGAPLGEFRMVPGMDTDPNWPWNRDCVDGHAASTRAAISKALLKWREAL